MLALQQADVFRVLQGDIARWVIRGINLLLVVWIASLLATLTWDLVTPQESIRMDDVEVSPLTLAADPGARLIRQLPGWHLMGVEAQKQSRNPVAVNTPIDAPDTRLKLVLRGVYVSDEAGKARAIIADPKGKEEQYAVGDRLPGNADLSEVYPDRVILQRNGRYETLRLSPDSKPKRGAAAKRFPGKKLAARQQQKIKEIRQKLKQSPKTLVQAVRATPYMGKGGKMAGYTLQPGQEPGLFRELGLQPGDIVVQINDIRLDSKEKGMQALKSIQSSDNASMTILRGGQERAMTFTMPE